MALKTGIPASDLQNRWTIEDYERALLVADTQNRVAAHQAGIRVKPHPARDWDLSDLDEAEKEARKAKIDAEYNAHLARYTLAFQDNEGSQ